MPIPKLSPLLAGIRWLNSIAAGLLFLTVAQSGARADSELKKAETASCRLLGPDAVPLAGAKVCQVADGIVSIPNSGALPYSRLKTFTTDADGKFEIPLENKPCILVALTDTGYVEATMEETPPTELRLQPWGRIKGRVRFGAQPAVDTEMAIAFDHYVNAVGSQGHNAPAPGVVWETVQMKTNRMGEFVVERVPAGKVSLGVVLGGKSPGKSILFTEHTEVKAGETAIVEFGGRGRPVVGKLAIPKEVEGKDWRAGAVLIETISPASMNRGAKSNIRRTSVTVADDGSFRAENVEPGRYQLAVQLMIGSRFVTVPGGRKEASEYTDLAKFYQDVIVSEIPGGVSDEPLDMGEVIPIHPVKVGDAAPPLDCADLDSNRRISLADLRGKFVLLEFVSTSFQGTPVLEKIWEEFKNRPDFTMISVSCYEEIEPGRSQAAKEALSWLHVHLPVDELRTMAKFGIRDVPSALLIGSDGKVIATELRGDEIRKAVSRVLEKH